ncbi:MAG: PhoU family transcriptional regulator [Helicobacteraceae bacterium]|nr:PhoU family transcriptional regulator [Helicobacteraceae bacterium]
MLANYEEKFNEIRERIIHIAKGLVKANEIIVEALTSCEVEKFNEAKEHIKNVSKITADIDNMIVTTLALHSPEARDLRTMISYLKITNELLRAATNTRSFIKGFSEICIEVDVKTLKEYAIPMQRETVKALTCMTHMISVDCVDEAQEQFNHVLICENKTDDLYEMIESSVLNNSNEISEFDKYHRMLSALRKSEKIADRAMSIASLLLFAHVGGEIHQV